MRALSLLVLLAVQLQEPPEAATPLVWKLGKSEFARYTATKVTFDSHGVERSKSHPARQVGVFGYEIADKTYYRPAQLDRAELPLLLGLSLPPRMVKAGAPIEWTIEIEEFSDLGPVTAKCKASRGEGAKVGDAYCVRLDLAAELSRSAKAPSKPLGPLYSGSFEATLLFDPAKGVARRLDFFIKTSVGAVDAKGPPVASETRERIDLFDVLPLRHRNFEAEVNGAIDRGIAWLWRGFKANENRWDAVGENATGPTALALLTILKGSMDRKDERLLSAMDWMMAQPLVRTYDVAISLLALDAFYSPAERATKPGAPAAADKDLPAKLDEGHVRWGQSAARWLELNIAEAMWSYPSTRSGDRDFSNTQYGVLGLYAASRLGFPVNLPLVQKVQDSYLRAQQKKGPRVEVAIGDADSAGKTIAKYSVEARGWPYYDHPDDPATGSMTAGGVASLVILDAIRRKAGDPKYDARDKARAREGIRCGWAWLSSRWTVKGNPTRGREWHYYFLYGLERCGMLDGVAKVGDHDWYAEGANWLVANQAADGTWFTGTGVWNYDVCFAILFLKRATVRVATGR